MNFYDEFKLTDVDGCLWKGHLKIIPEKGHPVNIECEGYNPTEIIMKLQSFIREFNAQHVNDRFINKHNR